MEDFEALVFETVSKPAVLGKFFHMYGKFGHFVTFLTKTCICTEVLNVVGKLFCNFGTKNGQKWEFSNLMFFLANLPQKTNQTCYCAAVSTKINF